MFYNFDLEVIYLLKNVLTQNYCPNEIYSKYNPNLTKHPKNARIHLLNKSRLSTCPSNNLW